MTAAKHQAIMDAATTLFLDRGYDRTSMDEVAALAAVGKQTVYKHFADKQTLFAEIVLATTGQVDATMTVVAEDLADSTDVGRGLTAFARHLLAALMEPRLIRLRRLIIASAPRFPELGRTWYEQGFERVLATLARRLSELTDRGALHLEDPVRSAEQFVGMLLWIPLNKAMFTGDDVPFTRSELDRMADAAAEMFLLAHLPGTRDTRSAATREQPRRPGSRR